MKDSKDTISNEAMRGAIAALEALAILDMLEREGMPAELPVEHRRKRREVKRVHGKMHCLECGFRIRGLHHAEGEHHRQGQGTWTDAKGEMHSSKGKCEITASVY